ncbi:hypothetical protein PENANT_c012G02921 [Penicillium antarcticum]|uniref:Alpha 1,4-glycosyltransferase domain-containing protein n=1 Tax=Penicillium antarcticum TaxID=416450 RepID=A0A1V6Q661_9EURO|nr:uncharacterized protein N7508_008158 [Penicillium antarcticum]KAJ5297909.1 hypothetical protein N7508_008158 [Penicillium antarcticum]OQD84719.1 hypothetical protein PENANT_c012G02921 [Penicillium antarcticum]
MPRFSLGSKLSILVIALVTVLYIAYPSSPSGWKLSRVAAGYHDLATHYSSLRVVQQKDPAAIENDSSETSANHKVVAKLVQDSNASPESERPKDEYDDIPEETPEERHCFTSGLQSSNPIPKIVNFIWLNRTELSFMSYLAIRSALVSLQPDQLNLHYTDLNENNEWLVKLRDYITLVHHDMKQEYPRQIEENWHLAHVSDVMRLDILQRNGGIYFDTDIIALQPFDNLLHSPKDMVLGQEGRNRFGLCNGIILGRKESAFMDRWKDSYSTFELGEWNKHSVILPNEWSLLFPEEVCKLAPSVFFWPSWDAVEYMHELLTDAQTSNFEQTLASNQGSMYPNQLAYHAWHQVAPQLNSLTPEIIMTRNTRFNILVRRFLE